MLHAHCRVGGEVVVAGVRAVGVGDEFAVIGEGLESEK
jgi:hypothetical protein